MSVLRLASVLVLSIVLSVLGASASAVAQTTPSTAPPGNSAVDQYRESMPPSSSKQRKLRRQDRDALERRGADGAALAAVLERSGGVPRAASSSGADDATGSGDSGKRGRSSSGADVRSDSDAEPGSTPAPEGGSAGAAAAAEDSRPIAPAAAASTVGPIPVWAMLVAAVALVGVGLAVRARATP